MKDNAINESLGGSGKWTNQWNNEDRKKATSGGKSESQKE